MKKLIIVFFILLTGCNNDDNMRPFLMSISSGLGQFIDGGNQIHRTPDLQSGSTVSGNGFTNTMLVFNKVEPSGDVSVYAGSDGRNTQLNQIGGFDGAVAKLTLAISSSTPDPLVFADLPLATLTDEIRLLDYPSVTNPSSVQGGCIDNRGNLWVTHFSDLLCINPSTNELLSKTTTVNGWHGLGYDTVNDKLYVQTRNPTPDGGGNHWIELWAINPVDNTVTLENAQEALVSINTDGLYMRPQDNTKLWTSIGDAVSEWDFAGNIINTYVIPNMANQSEGFFILGDYVYICADRYYHAANDPPNPVLGDVNIIIRHKIFNL